MTDRTNSHQTPSTRHPACHISDLDYADDNTLVTLFADMIQEAELLLHQVESASKSTRLFLNPSKTNDSIHSSVGSQIEKVEDFKYLGSYTNTT